jgi:hypothetical protein
LPTYAQIPPAQGDLCGLIRRVVTSAITGLRASSYRHEDMFKAAWHLPPRGRTRKNDATKIGLQKVLDRTLHEAISDSGNAQRSELPWLVMTR